MAGNKTTNKTTKQPQPLENTETIEDTVPLTEEDPVMDTIPEDVEEAKTVTKKYSATKTSKNGNNNNSNKPADNSTKNSDTEVPLRPAVYNHQAVAEVEAQVRKALVGY